MANFICECVVCVQSKTHIFIANERTEEQIMH